MHLGRHNKLLSVASAALLCLLARPVVADTPKSPVLDSLRALGLPAPDASAPRYVTIDLRSIGMPSVGVPSLDLPGIEVADLLDNALSFIGVPYRFGGNTPSTGFDCSGFVKYVFNKTFDLSLPRTAREMARTGMSVARGELKPGDLVFFNTRGAVNSHVGIYLGDSKFVHAPYTRARVRIDDLDDKYYRVRFNGARRVAPTLDAVETAPAPSFKGAASDFSPTVVVPAPSAPAPAPAPSVLIPAVSGVSG